MMVSAKVLVPDLGDMGNRRNSGIGRTSVCSEGKAEHHTGCSQAVSGMVAKVHFPD